MKALFIGGTGTISTDVVALAQQRGWEITLLNRGSKRMPEGIHSIIADINDEEAVAKAIALEHYDVVAQFIGYTAEDVKRDIRLFQNKTRQYIFISSASAYQKPLTDYRITESTPLVNPLLAVFQKQDRSGRGIDVSLPDKWFSGDYRSSQPYL